MADDLAADNRRLRAQVRRLEEDLADLKARYDYAQQLIRELRERVPVKDELRVGVSGPPAP